MAWLLAWFGGWPRGLPAAVPFTAFLGFVAWRVALRDRGSPGPAASPLPARLDFVLIAALALAYRLPALLHPWGFVNRDGAYGAFAAMHMLAGQRPAPPFTEGANYQGTLKAHLALVYALVTGSRDWSWLVVLASLTLNLLLIAGTMALARRAGGRAAALVAGAYLAVGPRFLTLFSLNSVGQYVDVLALGGLALAVLARLLQEGRQGAQARGDYALLGFLLGAAFWQQPVAISYLAVAALVLALRPRTWKDPWTLAVPAGALVGVLPVLVWNVQNHWASGDILGREPRELRAQIDSLPVSVGQTVEVGFPILAGLSAGHPWAGVPGLRAALQALLPLLFAATVGTLVREALRARRAGRSLAELAPAALAPLLMAASLAIFWAVASGRVYWRPRYLLPVCAATAVHLGCVLAPLFRRSRLAGALVLAPLLALQARGTVPRLQAAAPLQAEYEALIGSLDEKGIRTGYADFLVSAPVTMFTGERIVISPALGPTPAYESELHARRVAEEGPDAYLLLPGEDPEPFARRLRELGVGHRFQPGRIPYFYGFSRRVRLEEVLDFRAGEERSSPGEGE